MKLKMNVARAYKSPYEAEPLNPTRTPKCCPICGTPMTDEAVEMVMERLEALKDG